MLHFAQDTREGQNRPRALFSQQRGQRPYHTAQRLAQHRHPPARRRRQRDFGAPPTLFHAPFKRRVSRCKSCALLLAQLPLRYTEVRRPEPRL